jgi:hypothetical protein
MIGHEIKNGRCVARRANRRDKAAANQVRVFSGPAFVEREVRASQPEEVFGAHAPDGVEVVFDRW